MIFGNIRQEAAYGFLPEDLKEFFVYAASHELAGYEKGSHPIDGERFFVNIVEYETTLPENRFWEGEANSHVVLRPGDFLICYPNDGHRTAVAVDGPEKIRKAIFKVGI